ncbi:MAG: Zn-dependent oligopeptidase [Phycisphaerales bacterium]|nr:Zn-dependent oligopeptidase [Phycisphaerales bacterium]
MRMKSLGSLTAVVSLMTATTFVRAADIASDSPVFDAVQQAESEIQRIIRIPDSSRTFENTVWAMDDALARLEFNTSMTQFMTYVSPDPKERERGQRASQDLQNWLIDLEKNEELYHAIKAYAGTKPELKGENKRLLEHTLRDYHRAGMDLTKEERLHLSEIQKEIARLAIVFDENIREDDTAILVSEEGLAGTDPEWRETLKRVGDQYIITMDYPTFWPTQNYATNEDTRAAVWYAYKRRGGKQNVKVIEDIIRLRAEAAHMLGYAHPADYENEVRMSKNAQTILDFYEKLRPLVRKKALRDYEEFVTAKREQTGDPNAVLRPWDFFYYQNILMKEKYAVDTTTVKEYFPLESVIDGLFSITQSLYGIRYNEVTNSASALGMPLWHEDVRLFEVTDNATNESLGMFYIDLFPRDNKYGHAAQWGLKQHKKWADGTVQKPLAALVCNFTKPTATKPSLMTHQEVETFFHEFGHCLHTILSTANSYKFAGTSVERDFVEAPSQMFENWVWNRDVLRTFARHYQTGEPFPDDLLEGMIAARNLGSGMIAERQFYYGLFDLKCHLDPEGDLDTTKLQLDLWDPAGENVELYDPVPGTYFQAAFGHLTGYQAGYYGYQWSLVYACDMFQRFKELGMLDPEAGRYYRDKILSRGGTVDGLTMIEDYLGREPDLTAYLKHLGLDPKN